MTASEKLRRMETCSHCLTGDCSLGYDAPFDCMDCGEYADVQCEIAEVDDNVGESNVKIYVPANKIWGFYLQNIERCEKEMVLIAENMDTKYAVYITDDDGTPMLSVCKGEGKPDYEEYVLNADDCANSAKKFFLRYLVPFSIVDGKVVVSDNHLDDLDDDGCSRQDMEDEMYEREDELDLAMKDFLAVILQEPDIDAVVANHGQGFVEDVLEDILQLLAKEYRCEIFRPMFIEDTETKCEIYTQFPYEEGVDEDA